MRSKAKTIYGKKDFQIRRKSTLAPRRITVSNGSLTLYNLSFRFEIVRDIFENASSKQAQNCDNILLIVLPYVMILTCISTCCPVGWAILLWSNG